MTSEERLAPLLAAIESLPDDPPVRTLDPGCELHRVALADFPADSFNPNTDNKGLGSRFSPFTSAGRPVPTTYAAFSANGAIAETVFHDVSPLARRPEVDHSEVIDGRNLIELRTTQSLRLGNLTGVEIRRWRLLHEHIISLPARFYRETQRFAAAVHRQFDDMQGLIWVSRLMPGEESIILFGDRIDGDWCDVRNKRALDDPDGAQPVLIALADRAGIKVNGPETR